MTPSPETKPILFSGPMIRALLDGRKTMTRRVLKPQPEWARDGVVEDWRDYFYRATDTDIEGVDDGDGFSVLNADGSLKSPWRPSIHMPRKASRLTLEVTGVKVERLQDISRSEARAEGVATEEWDDWRDDVGNIAPPGSSIQTETDLFRDLWNGLNAARGFGWDANPWVVAVSFKVHQQNVDALIKQREAA